MKIHEAVVTKVLRPELAEWIWQDLISVSQDRGATTEIPSTRVSLTKLGLLVEIGKAPNSMPVPIAIDGRGRGIAEERQKMVNEGRAPALWQVVSL